MSFLNFETVKPILAALQPMLVTARRLAAAEHNGRLGDTGDDLFLELSAQHNALKRLLNNAGVSLLEEFFEPTHSPTKEESWLASRQRTAAYALRELIPEGWDCQTLVKRIGLAVELVSELVSGSGVPADKVEYSTPNSLTHWAKKFNMHQTTLKRHMREGKIKHKKLSDRVYQIAISDLPVDAKK